MPKIELQDIYKIANALYHACDLYETQEAKKGERWKFGEKALELVGDYPLYAPTSNLTYHEAIAVASVIFGDIDETIRTRQEQEKIYGKGGE